MPNTNGFHGYTSWLGSLPLGVRFELTMSDNVYDDYQRSMSDENHERRSSVELTVAKTPVHRMKDVCFIQQRTRKEYNRDTINEKTGAECYIMARNLFFFGVSVGNNCSVIKWPSAKSAVSWR